jgi:hemerythrin-like domain-containing protein
VRARRNNATTAARQGSDAPRRAPAAAIPANPVPLAETPIAHLFAEHQRIRAACDLLDNLARQPRAAGRQLPAMLEAFFREDFARHTDDEEEDFLPLLERRMFVGDTIDEALQQLRAEHAADQKTLRRLLPLLADLAQNAEISDLAALRVMAHSFAESVRRHMAWENVTIAAFAESRLTPEDRKALAAGMARRRRRPPGN